MRHGEQTLWIAGALLAACALWGVLRYQWFQHNANAAASAPTSARAVSDAGIRDVLTDVRVTGRLEVPSVRLTVAVVDGDEQQGLDLGAVHLAGTPAVGEPGNAVIAGHRDTAFWPLRHLKVGDRIRFRNGRKRFSFEVESMRIVSPDDMSVLANSQDGAARLTLLTCYPFRFVGSAPKRFVVQAKRIG